jgi:phage shock protein PspC (stress-responsive transcriptional regulator)
MRDLASLRRSTTDKHVAGVAGGLGRHFDIDPVIIRVAFVVLTFFGGAGAILYAACWLIVPDDHGSAVFSLDARSRNIALVAVGILAGLAVVGDAWGPGWFPWPLLVIGLVAWLLLSRRDRRQTAPGVAPAAPPGHAATPTAADPGTYADAWGGTSYAPGTRPFAYAEPPRRPRNPRKRGPKLFWWTAGLVLLALATLGIVDGAGTEVADGAYPALALGIIGTMLVIGSFFGRAGGLILLGVITGLVLTLTTVADRWDGDPVVQRPESAAEVQWDHDLDAGELVLDLTDIDDLSALDGRELSVDVGLGRIEVIVPEELTVDVDAAVGAGGEIRLFGDRSPDAWGHSMSRTQAGPDGAPELDLDLDVDFGEIVVVTR